MTVLFYFILNAKVHVWIFQEKEVVPVAKLHFNSRQTRYFSIQEKSRKSDDSFARKISKRISTPTNIGTLLLFYYYSELFNSFYYFFSFRKRNFFDRIRNNEQSTRNERFIVIVGHESNSIAFNLFYFEIFFVRLNFSMKCV